MKKENAKNLYFSLAMLILFALWTVLLKFVDAKAIGPQNSVVGFSAINKCFHNLTGVNMDLYTITDWLSLIPIGFALSFAVLGLTQWIKRKSLKKIDRSILALGVFYIVVFIIYLLFETLVINWRPVLINGYLEASYPSSTTILVLCIMLTAVFQLNCRIKHKLLKICVTSLIWGFSAFMVIGRLLSGVHWLSDIIGGILLSLSLVSAYRFVIKNCNA